MCSDEFYKPYIEDAFFQIMRICDSYIDEPPALVYQSIREFNMFNFSDYQSESYQFNLKESKNVAYQMTLKIVCDLLAQHNIQHRVIYKKSSKLNNKKEVMALLLPTSAGVTLILFKEYGIKNRLRQEAVKDMMSKCGAVAYSYVSYITDFAYTEDLGHDANLGHPSKGTDVLSFKYFFTSVLGEEEYQVFEKNIAAFTERVRSFLGMVYLRTLVPSNLYSFKRKLLIDLRNFQYESVINGKIDDNGLKIIKNRFFNTNLYKGLIGKSDYAQSFITAEWLYSSFEKAGSIDYTVVAMGYFKCVEQLLMHYALLPSHYGRKIKRKNIKNDTKYLKADGKYIQYVPINQENIDDGRLDTTIGSLVRAFYLQDSNDDLFYNDIDDETRNAIKSILIDIAPLRNGYFHTHNLNDWEVVKKAREVAYIVFFLIIGAYQCSEQESIELKLSLSEYGDYEKLKQYIREHRNYLYYFCDELPDKSFLPIRSWVDYDYTEDGNCIFGDIHIGRLAVNEDNILEEEFIPSKVYVGWMTPPKSLDCDITDFYSGPQVLIYEDGKFCAPENDDFPT